MSTTWRCRDCDDSMAVSLPKETNLDSLVVQKWAGEPFVVLNLVNDSDRPLIICVEPWANEYPFPPHTAYQLELLGVPPLSGPSIEVDGDRLTVYPETSGFRLRSGEEVIDE